MSAPKVVRTTAVELNKGVWMADYPLVVMEARDYDRMVELLREAASLIGGYLATCRDCKAPVLCKWCISARTFLAETKGETSDGK
jgi:hypothetical protein